MTAPTDHDLIVEMHTDMKRVLRVLDGNGKQGLIADVVEIRTDLDNVREDLREVKRRAPSRKERVGGWVAVIAAFMMAASPVAVALVNR